MSQCEEDMTKPLLFDGLKVVDAASWVAAPAAATILGDLGASVTKIEMPGGDPFRRLARAPGTPHADIDYCWAQDARGKRSIALNLKTDEGLEVLHALVKSCDVYVTNYPLGMRERLGLTYEELKGHNPRMIYASLTAYGEHGPEREREGFDLAAYWGRSGLMDLVRTPGSQPSNSVPGMGDHPTAVALYGAIVTALLHRERTGEGSHVHTSLIANGTWAASCIAAAKFAYGSDFSTYPHVNENFYTRKRYETADGRWIMFQMVRGDEMNRRLFAVLEISHLFEDPRFSTSEARIESSTELQDVIRRAVSRKPARQWLARCADYELPVTLVGTLDDLPQDPQLRPNGILREPDDEIGADYVINHPINVDAIGSVGVKRAPDVGEHTEEVLAELGYDQKSIDRLRELGVV